MLRGTLLCPLPVPVQGRRTRTCTFEHCGRKVGSGRFRVSWGERPCDRSTKHSTSKPAPDNKPECHTLGKDLPDYYRLGVLVLTSLVTFRS